MNLQVYNKNTKQEIEMLLDDDVTQRRKNIIFCVTIEQREAFFLGFMINDYVVYKTSTIDG